MKAAGLAPAAFLWAVRSGGAVRNIDAGEMRSRRLLGLADLKGRAADDRQKRLAAITALPSLVPLLARRAKRTGRQMRITPLIRPMKEGDVDIVARLRCAAFFEGTDRTVAEDAEGLRQLMLDGRFEAAFVAELNGIPVGSCLFVRKELDAAHDMTPWLAGLVVSPGSRGRGTGRALVRAVEAHALSIGVAELHLYTWEARAFYHALGWQAVETFQQDGQPMMLMSRQLAGGRKWPR